MEPGDGPGWMEAVVLEVVREIWRRALSTQPDPSAAVVATTALAALALVLAPATWRFTRLLVTITHEGAHAVVAVAVGRRLRGIRLHSDTSGLTVSQGRATGPGMVAMLAAGYLGPAVVGLGAAALLIAGHALAVLWLVVALLGLMVLQIRNFYGFAVVVFCGGATAATSWHLSAPIQAAIAYLLTWVLLIAAPKPVLELIRRRRRRTTHSDTDKLGRLTTVPGSVWAGLFLAANFAGLALGVVLLLPALVELLQAVGVRLLD